MLRFMMKVCLNVLKILFVVLGLFKIFVFVVGFTLSFILNAFLSTMSLFMVFEYLGCC